MSRISVIIPTYNRGSIFLECLDSVVKSIRPDDEIIIINDSKTDELAIPGQYLTDAVHLYNNPLSGVASARNLGAAKAKGTYLLFIDDDMIINRHAVESCLEEIQQNPQSVINADWIYDPKIQSVLTATKFGRYLNRINFTSLEGWCTDLEWKKNSLVSGSGITSQFLLMHKENFDRAKGYNEQFPFAGFEDYDLGVKLKNAGISFFINTKCLVYHNEKDRISLLPFLERKKRGAFTRKKGVELGYSELQITFSPVKRGYFQLAFAWKPVYLFLCNVTPNNKLFDPLYTFMVNRLLGIAIYEGYSKKDIQ